METSSKIMLLALPAAFQTALLQQLDKGFTRTMQQEDADLVICGAGLAEGFTPPPAIPVLPVRLDRPQRLGLLLRQARQMLDEPSLYLDAFRIGPYLFSPQEKTLSQEGRDDILLTDKEVDILVYLARSREGSVPRDLLLRHVWRYQEGVDTHTLETHIYRLRQKIEISAEAPQLLVTDEKGYRLHS